MGCLLKKLLMIGVMGIVMMSQLEGFLLLDVN